ncbi:MAG: Gfo/Idh/MocA family oxidoreductase [Rhizobiales bacterium]|nr:Gfo/Idh/MocA family oxidoreductase [Hyphomicrobiales bacterium]
MTQFKQNWDAPAQTKPIVIIGTGGIVTDAHLPAYKKAKFEVEGIYDLDINRAATVAKEWNVKSVYSSIEDAVSLGNDVIYDLALPPSAISQVLKQLPDEAAVLIQKPMGENFTQAKEILMLCQSKKLSSAVNFQLRFSPQMLAVKDIIGQGLLGEILEVEVHLNVNTPWSLFPFLRKLQRVEIAVHSIHYLDLIRAFIGEPNSVFAKTMADKRNPEFAQTRTSTILDYGDDLRCLMSINHNHIYGNKFQASNIRIEGSKGAIHAQIGINLNYPKGEPDELWLASDGADWQQIQLAGEWFPDAFIGTMSNLQRVVSGEDSVLVSSTEDALGTMALVEACFIANKQQGTKLPSLNRQFYH